MGSGVKDDNDFVPCFQCSFVYLVIEVCSVVPSNSGTEKGLYQTEETFQNTQWGKSPWPLAISIIPYLSQCLC